MADEDDMFSFRKRKPRGKRRLTPTEELLDALKRSLEMLTEDGSVVYEQETFDKEDNATFFGRRVRHDLYVRAPELKDRLVVSVVNADVEREEKAAPFKVSFYLKK